MDDKTAGELWRTFNSRAIGAEPSILEGLNLIRKLVEDRIRFYRVHYGWGPDYAKGAALDDFNIDPKTWHEG